MTAAGVSVPRRRGGERAGILGLSTLLIAGAGIIGGLGLLVSVPSTFADEAIYVELARHLGGAGRFEILGVPFPAVTYGPAYVAVLAPIFRFSTTAREAYMLARGLNAVLFASAVIPAFLIAARAVSRRSALIVATAAIALPASIYTTKIMTESLAYPVMLWTVLAALCVLERQTAGRQATLLLCLVATVAVRFQLIVLGPALALGCVAGMNGRLIARCRSLALLIVGTASILVGAFALMQATSTGGGAGAHGLEVRSFSVARFGALVVGSLGAIDLYTGVLPFACFVIVAVGVRRRAPWLTSDVRAVALLASASGLGLLVTGSAYLATVPEPARPPVPADRYMFYVAPLIFVIFAAWVEAGAVRDNGTAWLAAGAAALPLLAGAVCMDSDPHGTPNALAFSPWLAFADAKPTLLLVEIGLYCALCALLLARRKTKMHTLAKTVLVLVTITCVFNFYSVVVLSSRDLAPPPGWLDTNARQDVIAVLARKPRSGRAYELWQIAVTNRNLTALYRVGKADPLGQEVGSPITKRSDGTLLDHGKILRAHYVLTTAFTHLAGTLVAKRNGWAIYKVRSAVRLSR